jgi:uncharacterized protein (TIGR03435 family)
VRRDIIERSTSWSDRPILDQTGVTGLYSIQTQGWTASDDDPNRPTLKGILDGLGLKLVNKRALVDVFTIEHLEKPSEN